MLYVGQSTNVRQRISQHRSNGIEFIGFFCDECEKSELLDLEAEAIREFKPILNEANTLIHNPTDNSGHIKSDRKRKPRNTMQV